MEQTLSAKKKFPACINEGYGGEGVKLEDLRKADDEVVVSDFSPENDVQ